MMRTTPCIALWLVALSSLLGCGGRDNRAFTAAAAWYRVPPIELLDAHDLTPLDKGDFALVTEPKQAEAQAKLEDAACKKLSSQEAEDLLGKPIEGQDAGELVLLRAVTRNEGTGAFDVAWRDGVVVVHHGCLGRHSVPMNRRALVAKPPTLPKEVSVHCSMAE